MVSMQYPDTGPGRGGPGASGDLVACPECELPAEITERFWLDSTDGPVLHVCLTCIDGHYFRMPAEQLFPAVDPTPESLRIAWRTGSAPDGSDDASAPSSSVGLVRLPGRLGTVANLVSDGMRDEQATASLA